MEMIRTCLMLNALVAFFSCAGLCIDLAATFYTQTPKFSGLYWQYWIYFGTFVLSILVALIISVHLLRYKLLRHSRAICLTPLMLFFTTLASCIIFDDKTSWIDLKTDAQSTLLSGLFFHCGLYNAERDSAHPTLYHRCMLVDATWLSGVLVCLLWLALFFILWFTCSSYFDSSPTQSTSQVYKYEISDSQPKFSPPTVTSQSSIMNNITTNKKMYPASGRTDLKYLTYLPTKSLPPLNQRPSEDTLCLPIHSNTTTAIGSSYGDDNLFCGSILQPHEEKVQVSDSWLQNFGPSIAITAPSGSCSKNYAYSHSMDLGWMKRMHHQQRAGDTENDDDEDGTSFDDKDYHRIQQRDGGFIYPNSRRMVIAQSCPEFNNKKINKLLNTSSNGIDGTSLRY